MRPALKADKLAAICEKIVQRMPEFLYVTTLWAYTACYRDILFFPFFYLLISKLNVTDATAKAEAANC
jgi:hypothetical protein